MATTYFNLCWGFDETDHQIRSILSKKEIIDELVDLWIEDEGSSEANEYWARLVAMSDLQLLDLAIEELEAEEEYSQLVGTTLR